MVLYLTLPGTSGTNAPAKNQTTKTTYFACAGVCGGAGLVRAAKATRSDDGAVGTKSMDGTIFHAPELGAMGPGLCLRPLHLYHRQKKWKVRGYQGPKVISRVVLICSCCFLSAADWKSIIWIRCIIVNCFLLQKTLMVGTWIQNQESVGASQGRPAWPASYHG